MNPYDEPHVSAGEIAAYLLSEPMPLRTASRIDANQPEIVAALRRIGATILHTHQLKNCFDLLVGYRGRTFLMEIKASDKEPLTPGEAEFKRTWRGSPYHIVTSVDQAIRIITSHP